MRDLPPMPARTELAIHPDESGEGSVEEEIGVGPVEVGAARSLDLPEAFQICIP
jgi:hypothetical protein